VPYNAAVTDRDPTPDEPTDPKPDQTVGAGERPSIDVSKLPEVPTFPRPHRTPGTNIGRWATFGCVAVLLLLVVLLLFGVNLTKRTMWMAYARAQQRLVESLAAEVDSGERMRTERNLQRFRARLEITEDPFPLMGDLMGRITAALEDESVSAEELSELNAFLEHSLESPGADSP
jgi:hypothetical protein